MATARGLGLGLNATVWPVDSLEALAMNGAASPRSLLPLIDARKSEVYGAVYRWGDGGEMSCLLEAQVAPVAELLERARAVSDDLLVFGSGAVVSGLGQEAPVHWHIASAAHVGALAARDWEAAGRDGRQAPAFDPAYVRASDAEIALEERRLAVTQDVEPGR